jgi:iron complex outermembrane receptor protein
MNWKTMVYLNRGDKTAYQDIKKSGEFFPDRNEKFPDNKVWGAEIQNTLQLFETADLTTGVAFKRVSMDYKEIQLRNFDRDVSASGEQRFISPFVEGTARFMDNRLVVNAGVRYDNVRNYDGKAKDTDPFRDREPYDETYDSETWDNFSPKIGLVYHPDDLTTLRTSFVYGFRTPTLFELYKPHVRAGGRFLRRANPELDPEEIRSWEAGAERVFFDSLWLRATYYHSRVSDYIESTTIAFNEDTGARDTENQNKSEVEINGVEAELEYYIGHGLSTFLNYTYNLSEIEDDDENPDREGNYLAGIPRHKFRAGVTYQNPAIINASVMLRHDRHIYTNDLNTDKAPNSTTLDISFWRQVFDLATLRFTIENATDETEYIEDGRIYYGSVQFDF